MAPVLPQQFEPLRQQLLAVARKFSDDAHPLGELLDQLVRDVERAAAEPLHLFPVCHHSPAAAVHMVRRLREQPPRVLFIEMCEDFRPAVEKLRDCKLPVALQAFAGQTDAFPKSWAPLSVVAPFTEFSAEFQAIAFALENPSTDLVFVDRAADHVFQWMPQKDDELSQHVGEEPPDNGPEEEDKPQINHGGAVGVQVGDLEPTFDRFREFLLQNARVRYFAEWWDQYVEQAVVGADYETYRGVLFLVGSLLRRLGQKPEDLEDDRRRERFMWTRMKEYLNAKKIAPHDAIHVCGAIHAVSDIEEFGVGNQLHAEIPPRTATPWLYGVIPSSHAAIDAQFHFPPGTVTLSMTSWEKARRALNLKPFKLAAAPKRGKKTAVEEEPAPDATASPIVAPTAVASLSDFLIRPPALGAQDEEQLLSWSVGIVELARRNGYLASTADSIAVYQTAVLLAGMRDRRHPSPYDFRDAAVTCLEKDRVPGKRNVARLCDVLLGGDRIGQVGFASLPPLAQDVLTRLEPLGVNLRSTTIQRALIDFRSRPDLLPCSELLWRLRYLLSGRTVRPIMGEKALGQTPVQESWDLEIGKDQTPIIQLGYEGVTVEAVLEKRLHERAFGPTARAGDALAAAEDSILYLHSPRLTDAVGGHATTLLVQETSAQSAPEVFDRVRRLTHFYRSTPDGLPGWIKDFVATGYSHYCTLLPTALADRGTSPEQVAGLLSFVFQLESLALSLGCNRSQLVIAVAQAGPQTDDPNKLGLLWTAQWLLGQRDAASIREFFARLLDNSMAVGSVPAYLNGFLLALKFTPLVARLAVELLSAAFAKLPDRVLMPWLPGLLVMLRGHGGAVLQPLLKEASSCFPSDLAGLLVWRPPWEAEATPPPAKAPASTLNATEKSIQELLRDQPDTTNALAVLLGLSTEWSVQPASGAVGATARETPAGSLLVEYPATTHALAALLSASNGS